MDCKSFVSKSAAVIQHWPIRTITNDITSILIGHFQIFRFCSLTNDLQTTMLILSHKCYGPWNQVVKAWEWGQWRSGNEASEGLGMRSVVAWEWGQRRPGNEASEGLGMRPAKAWEWGQRRSGSEAREGLGMRPVKAWEWGQWRPGNEASEGLGAGYHQTSIHCWLWTWQPNKTMRQKHSYFIKKPHCVWISIAAIASV